MQRIHLWSSPRNISTALMYSFGNRLDTSIIDEPLYAYYLKHTDSQAQHPGYLDIMDSQSSDGEAVIRDVILGDHYPTPIVVFKQMTHHLMQLDKSFMHQCQHVLLIRDPRAILASYTKVIQQPTPYDIGIPQQDELYRYLKKHSLLSAIIDAKHLLLNPREVLSSLCKKINIPYSEKMLEWPIGPRTEDGVWAKHWYGNVHQSNSFKPYVDKEIILSPTLEQIAEQCMPAYQTLLHDDHTIKTET